MLESLGQYAGLFLLFDLVILYLIISYLRRLYEDSKNKRQEKRPEIQAAYNEYKQLYESESYFTRRSYRDWETRWAHIRGDVIASTSTEPTIISLRTAFNSGEKGVSLRNVEYVKLEKIRWGTFFDAFNPPLNESQRHAIVVDEQNNLVVAGAGTGKTKTILGKAAYLTKKGLADPPEILILAFNRSVKEEITEKTRNMKIPCDVHTFHSLGLNLIANTTGYKPSVTELSEDRVSMSKQIQSYLSELTKPGSQNQDHAVKLTHYFAYHAQPTANPFNFTVLGDYYRYLKEHEIRTLTGKLVKSQEECIIANFLQLNGVGYEYEPPYKVNTATIEHRQYKPDLYLPKHGIYIEHFALNKEGKTPPFIDNERYTEEIQWKRDTHKKNNTPLIETYSYQHEDGTLLPTLRQKLEEHGVKLTPVPIDEILSDLKKTGEMSQLAFLISKFLNLFKASNATIAEVRKLAESHPDPRRAEAFLDLFEPILDLYTEELAVKHEIDFNDMINEATKYLQNNAVKTSYKYILVDEYQDISPNRYDLLNAIQKNCGAKLFCVGDDWQAIYRFTGGDLALMTGFEKNLDPCELLPLNQTYRFNSGVLDVSSKFVTQNPSQIKKQLLPREQSEEPTMHILPTKRSDSSTIEHCLKEIETAPNNSKPSVFILGRYHYNKPVDLDQLSANHPRLNIEYHTAHSSKGLEADYVIINDIRGGRLGFPCQIEDDPILFLVMKKPEPYPNAEERRLFYVAMTRTKHRVYLLVDAKKPSSFITELENGTYSIKTPTKPILAVKCPRCKTGILTKRLGKNGLFYSCSNYPLCDYKTNPCKRCGIGLIHRENNHYICSNLDCKETYLPCPRCGDGYLLTRDSTNSQFFGCSNYPTCSYKQRKPIVSEQEHFPK